MQNLEKIVFTDSMLCLVLFGDGGRDAIGTQRRTEYKPQYGE